MFEKSAWKLAEIKLASLRLKASCHDVQSEPNLPWKVIIPWLKVSNVLSGRHTGWSGGWASERADERRIKKVSALERKLVAGWLDHHHPGDVAVDYDVAGNIGVAVNYDGQDKNW